MSWKQVGPGGVRCPATVPEDSWRRSSYPSNPDSQALCDLHGVKIVDEFPSRCPLVTGNPLVTMGNLQDVAWRELGRGDTPDADRNGALELLNQLDICNSCLEVNLRHRTVGRLRRKLGVTR